jgi:hypothetical protein
MLSCQGPGSTMHNLGWKGYTEECWGHNGPCRSTGKSRNVLGTGCSLKRLSRQLVCCLCNEKRSSQHRRLYVSTLVLEHEIWEVAVAMGTLGRV